MGDGRESEESVVMMVLSEIFSLCEPGNRGFLVPRRSGQITCGSFQILISHQNCHAIFFL